MHSPQCPVSLPIADAEPSPLTLPITPTHLQIRASTAPNRGPGSSIQPEFSAPIPTNSDTRPLPASLRPAVSTILVCCQVIKHTHAHIYLHTHRHMHTHAHPHTHIPMYTHTPSPPLPYTHSHPHIHTHTYTHIHTHVLPHGHNVLFIPPHTGISQRA